MNLAKNLESLLLKDKDVDVLKYKNLPYRLCLDLDTTGMSLVYPEFSSRGGALTYLTVRTILEDESGVRVQDTNSFDKLYGDTEIATEIGPYGLFIIHEFRSIYGFTMSTKFIDRESYYRNLMLCILGSNLYWLRNKIISYKKNYLEMGKNKGLSKVEFEYIRYGIVPLYVKLYTWDIAFLEDYFKEDLQKVCRFLDVLFVEALDGNLKCLKLDTNIVFGGHILSRDSDASLTVYCTRGGLAESNYMSLVDLYTDVENTIKSMPASKLLEGIEANQGIKQLNNAMLIIREK